MASQSVYTPEQKQALGRVAGLLISWADEWLEQRMRVIRRMFPQTEQADGTDRDISD